MIVAKCPLRVSLAGGGSDLQESIDYYRRGGAINFATNLYTYVTINEDVFGLSSKEHKYIINYSTREEETNIDKIKNDIPRECFRYFKTPPNTSSLTADIYSSGSGLASSSSYLISFIKALLLKHDMKLSNENVCGLAINLERKFNPLTGYQDPYGCGIGGLKRLDMEAPNIVTTTPLPQDLLSSLSMYLIYTTVSRSSTALLEKIDIKKGKHLLSSLDKMEKCIKAKDIKLFFNIINEGWIKKKESSHNVISHPKVKDLDQALEDEPQILAHRLCGAGNGGFFLAFADHSWTPHKNNLEKISLKINISNKGAQATKL